MNSCEFLRPLEQASAVDVLIWARIRAKKSGSFEAYLAAMVKQCQSQGLSVALVVGQETQAELVDLMWRTGVFVVEMPTQWWDSIRMLNRILRAFRPRIVHFHFYSVISALWLVANRHGRIVYLSAHNSLPEPSATKRMNWLMEGARKLRRWYFGRRIDRFLPVSAFLAQDLLQTSCVRPSRIQTIPNGVDCERFCPVTAAQRKSLKERLSLDPDKTVIAFVGQIELHKGIQDFCAAMLALADRHDIQVVIAGEGSQSLVMQERYPHWHWLGSVDNVQQVLQASDILVCPSRWQEAFGLVIAEAMACGVPVIGSNRGGIPEVISNRETGFLFPAGDVDAMCQCITELLNDHYLHEKMSKAARSKAISAFALEHQVERTVDLYQQDLAGAA